MGDDDDFEVYTLASKLGVSPNDIWTAKQEGSWPEEIRKILIEQARKKHVPQSPPQSPPAARRIPATVKPPAAKDPPAPILMRATLRVHPSKFTPDYLPRRTINEMMRNQVVPALPSTIPTNMIEWCEKNCGDLWMASPPQKPEYIMFASEVDMTLFLTAFGGG